MTPRNELASIVDRLSSIQQIFEHLVGAEEKERKRQQEREKIPLEITGTFRLPEAIETKRSTDQKRYHTTQKVIAVATWAAFLAATIYAGIAAKQLKQMRVATEAAQKSADAAKSAADTANTALVNSQKSFEIDQRPNMVADTPVFSGNGLSPDKAIQANITFKNIGRTPGRKYAMNVNLLRFDPGKGAKGRNKLIRFLIASFGTLKSKNASARKELEKYGIEQDIAPNATVFTTNPSDGPNSAIIPIQEFPKIETGEISLFYVGVVTYSDAFQGSYQTEFCYVYFGTDPKTWHFCDSHNTIE
jgi:hypothetical protein